MIITTSISVEGRNITDYLGIVSAALVVSLAGGGKMLQNGWRNGVDHASEILMQQAYEIGADAVIAARFEPAGGIICATGTAVKLL